MLGLYTKDLFIYLALPTTAGSPQQHMPITVGPFCLTHPVNFPCGRKPEYPEETHDFRQSVDKTCKQCLKNIQIILNY